jgi:hypothetical protein
MAPLTYRYPTAESYQAIAERARRERAGALRVWLRNLRLRFALPDFGPDTPEPRRPRALRIAAARHRSAHRFAQIL